MPEQLMRDFAARAERAVTLPDLAELEWRGRSRRTRRLVAVAAAAAMLVGAALVAGDQEPRAEQPVTPDLPDRATTYVGGPSAPRLEPGTYELRPSVPYDAPRANVTVPAGWRGWIGPNRSTDGGYVGLLVLDVKGVVASPCESGPEGMTEVGDDPVALVRALQGMPRHQVVAGPEPDHRFGWPATRMTVQASSGARCPGDYYFWLWDSGSGLVQAYGPGARMDLWVVDVEGQALLVSATSADGTPERLLTELEGVVSSVEIFLPGEPPEG